jgi:hypothetical protein
MAFEIRPIKENRYSHLKGSAAMCRSPIRYVVVALLILTAQPASGGEQQSGRAEFPLTEVSGLGTWSGQHCPCTDKPESGVTYPTFLSANPLYGSVRVDASFVDPKAGVVYRFALDESAGTGRGYDRLYVDLDRDNNLANETPIARLENPPSTVLEKSNHIVQQPCFNQVSLPGSAGDHSLPALPRLVVNEDGYSTLTFLTVQARQGRIRIGGYLSDIVLSNESPIGTRWDRPETELQLRVHGSVNLLRGELSDRLMAMPRIDGRYWRLSTTPEGDRLFVEPYSGDLGTITIGGGSPFVGSKGLEGTLFNQDRAVQVGAEFNSGRYEPVRSCQVPVGDYATGMMGVYYGPLYISLSDNYHSDGRLRERDAPAAYPVRIRKDKPFVLAFGNKPDVLFASPARDSRVKIGETLAVYAVLVDPKLDIMIRGLKIAPYEEIASRIWITLSIVTAGPFIVWLAGGKNRHRRRALLILSALGLLGLAGCIAGLRAYNTMLVPKDNPLATYDDLPPMVTIQRANGELVTNGTMPFG